MSNADYLLPTFKDLKMLQYNNSQIQTLDYCTYCPRLCHFSCPAAIGEGSQISSPWGKMTLANLERKGELLPSSDFAAAVYLCVDCRRCQDFCLHKNDVPSLLRIAKARMVSHGKEPSKINEIRVSYENSGTPISPTPAFTAYLKKALKRTKVSKTGDKTRIAFFPSSSHQEDLNTAQLDQTMKLISLLSDEPVALGWDENCSCCGCIAERAGLIRTVAAQRKRLWKSLNKYELILTDCTDLVEARPNEKGPEIIHLTRFLADHTKKLAILADKKPNSEAIQLHGGCRERRYLDLSKEEQNVLTAIGFEVSPFPAHENSDECCGGEYVFKTISPKAAKHAAETLNTIFSEAKIVTSAHRCACHLSDEEKTIPSLLDLVLERCLTQKTQS